MVILTKRTGFTLIELSIVFVIIGLIIGGVLAGKELIHAAEVRKTVSMIQEANTAINTFINKYNCIPGDCKTATTFFGANANCETNNALTGSGTCNGDGNGQIDESYPIGCCGYTYMIFEHVNVWNHLSLAGLYGHDSYQGTGSLNSLFSVVGGGPWGGNGPTPNPPGFEPLTPMGYFLTVFWATPTSPLTPAGNPLPAGHYFTLTYGVATWSWQNWDLPQGGYTAPPYDPSVAVVMLPIDAESIDMKIDDGMPYTGMMQDPYSEGCAEPAPWAISTANPYDTTTANFRGPNYPYEEYGCTILIKAEGF